MVGLPYHYYKMIWNFVLYHNTTVFQCIMYRIVLLHVFLQQSENMPCRTRLSYKKNWKWKKQARKAQVIVDLSNVLSNAKYHSYPYILSTAVLCDMYVHVYMHVICKCSHLQEKTS